ncbi:efflux RND transporter periplasmic adaptor subunit [Roseateles depolymerans]|uniref:Cytochrome C peroxidase n=1 Tax=Roseateles depolymerans TaxID=76731 RepID=A0A0U3CKP6_9BURK|nr:efflux RND transporter periplasmic adaptor subunit [Roseateles depolymerans]ALV09176.1 cytochrome C peroxidase [Roseateles depolymerans]REG13934.1 cobalt-zinc-cadmium efflux system membrane fusion protein [Roseateles depolymerans]
MNSPYESKDGTQPVARRKQAIAIAVVLALGVAAGIGILSTGGRAGAGGEAAHGHEDGEDHNEGDAHAHAKSGADKGHGGEKPASTEKPHDDAGAPDVITLTPEQQKAAGIVVDTAKAATLTATYQLPGEVKFNEDTTAHVVPRVVGVVESVPAALGQVVRRGQVLAVLSSPAVSDLRADLQAAQKRLQLARTTYEREKSLFEARISPQQDVQGAEQALREAEIAVTNARQKLMAVGATPDSSALNRFELRAPFDGTIVEKHIALGEQVREDTNVFTVADLRTVWAQISVPAKDLPLVRVGDRVTVRATAFDQSAVGKVAYVGSLIGESTRTAQARVTLENPKATWRPGLFVNVEMKGDAVEVPVTVAADAVQTVEERPVVFVQTPRGFQAQPVKIGRSDGQRTEIVQGLTAGTPYIATGSFMAKAELGKSTASHAH